MPTVFVSVIVLFGTILPTVSFFRLLALQAILASISFMSCSMLDIGFAGMFSNLYMCILLQHAHHSPTSNLYITASSARGAKFQGLKQALINVPEFEAVEIDDVSTADFTDAFKGMSTSSSLVW
jgi:hypothetical protein